MALATRGFPLLLTFELDAETIWTARDPAYAARPVLMSQGAYGWKIGIWRVIDLLRRYALQATFFVPGIVVEQRPQVIEALLRDGHEIAHHGHTHAAVETLTEAAERAEMEHGIAAIRRATGAPPRGYRSPSGELSRRTPALLRDYGFGYASNFRDDDSAYLLEVAGAPTDIVELPCRAVMDDATFFEHAPVLPDRVMQPPAAVLDVWTSELDTLEAEDRLMVLTLHPALIGQPSRLPVLDGIIQHALSTGDVWIGRCDEISDDLRPRLLAGG